MINILWSQFDSNQQAKDISFESFCFQVAYLRYSKYGYFDNFYNTPGSEFYLLLHTDCPELNLRAGDEIGWQVKWWYNTEDNTSLTKERRTHLENNFATTLKEHPNIKLWIVCTPASFKESAFKELKTSLNKLSSKSKILHWNKETFKNFLSSEHSKFGGLFHHYFNTNFISFDVIKEYTQQQIQYLHTKFDTDLYVPSDYDEEILYLLNYKEIYNEIELKSTYIQDDIKSSKKNIERKDLESFLNADYAKDVLALIDFICNTLDEVCIILDSKLSIEKCRDLDEKIKSYLKTYRSYADKLNKTIKDGKWAKSKKEKQYDWRHEDIIEQIHLLHSHFVAVENFERRIHNHKSIPTPLVELLDLIYQKEVHILSSAGYGKTNIACNIAKTCIEKNIPAVLFLGSNFRKSDFPQKIALESLGLERYYDFKQFLRALNTLGFIKGFKIPIIIDGLNESNPYKEIWRTNIYDIITEIKKLDYICLITTCRDRYINSIFEKNSITDIQNTFVLEGLTEKQKKSAVPKYFNKYHIVPTSWNFNKDLFNHPLLLKIFSEANTGSRNINISIDNVFQSFDKYYDNIIRKVTDDDNLSKKNINSRVSQVCEKLWNDNSRDIDIVDFVSIISPNSDTLAGTIADKILDEGLCLFQRNLDETDNEKIQFAYDLVAGYLIASKVLLVNAKTADDAKEWLNKNDIQNKLFTEDNAHPLAEDIMISLLYLLPSRYGVEFFELFDNTTTLEISYRNIDYYIGNTSGQEKLRTIFSKSTKDDINHNLLLSKLYENIFQKKVHGLSLFTMSVLLHLKQTEIDILWTEIIRKNNATTYDLLEAINKASLREKLTAIEAEECFYISFISTVSTDQILRDFATENLYLIGRSFPNQLFRFCKQCFDFKDANAIESLIASICGTLLAVREKDLTENALKLMISDFLPNWKNTHIGVIEYILTITEFAYENFKLDYRKKIKFNKSNFRISTKKPTKSQNGKAYSRFNASLSGVDMYDFVKHQIAGISTSSYEGHNTFSESDCIEIILKRVKENGYNEKLFDSINKQFKEEKNYRYGYGSKIKFYAEKYLWQSYFEFVGYVFLDDRLKSDDKNRYRCLDVRYDPTFPRRPVRNQIIANCFFPSSKEEVQEWIDSDDNDFIDSYYIHKLFTNEEWVLLSASINQKGKENDTQFNLFTHSFLTSKSKINKFKKSIENGSYYSGDSNSFYNIYAGEINWSKFVKNTDRSYGEEEFEMDELVWEYRWSGWSNNRYQNPSFPFLNPKISNINQFYFNPKDLSFYNSKNELVTKLIWTESAKLYYIKKEFLESIIEQQKKELVWYQFVSKYGEFGKYSENKLNPTYKDLRKLLQYGLMKII
ncbi:hypothetical protein BN1195_02410 [Chryseobacterium oranimense G311]|uniref:hypothetical protein n=1 Tax=Chryseobacterium oranimense TaxID=421058 RepID=UPI000533A296|nr:hypothetical protein [Chryseobacterium oranimense]CEJ70106.1 hypothetical protein BN1195_02410 [Chryseobacterium oranimense G311]